MRLIALTASVALVAVHWDRKGAWFWVGVGLVALNVAGILSTRWRSATLEGRGSPRVPSPAGSPLDHGDGGGRSHRLDEWLSLPGVAAAFAAGPELWRQVSHVGDDQFGPMTAREVAHFVWIEEDQGWVIGLDDEVKPYLDLDVDEADDPIIRVLKAHPSVEDAFHEDREVYRLEHREPLSTEELAVLVARALVAHHVHAAARS